MTSFLSVATRPNARTVTSALFSGSKRLAVKKYESGSRPYCLRISGCWGPSICAPYGTNVDGVCQRRS